MAAADALPATGDGGEGGTVILDDLDAGKRVYESVKTRLVCSGEVLYWKDENSLWITDKDRILSKLKIIVAFKGFCKETAKGGRLSYSGNHVNMINVAKIVMDLARSNPDHKWIGNWTSSSVGKLLFNNGYQDFESGRFISRASAEFDESIVFNEIAEYDFRRCEDLAYLEHVDDVIFNDALGCEVGQYTKQKIAKALAGQRTKHASVLFGIGEGDAGKSLMGVALHECAGGYVGDFNGNNLRAKKMESNDEASALRWVGLLKNKRIIISQELGMGSKINGEILKKLTGGDRLVARDLYQAEKAFNFNGMLMVYCNDAPQIVPYDKAVANRVRVLPYEFGFTDNPSGMFEKQRDEKLETEVRTSAFKCALVTVLLDSYTAETIADDIPCTIESAKDQFESETGNIIETIAGSFEISGDARDFLPSRNIAGLFSKEISPKKVSIEINKYCTSKGIENVKSTVKKVCGKSTRGWSGIKELGF